MMRQSEQPVSPAASRAFVTKGLLAGLLVATLVGLAANPPLFSFADAASARSRQVAAASDFGFSQVREINRLIQQGWQDQQLTPSKPATDAEWCRRVYLDLIGRIPSVQELEAYQSDRSANKRRLLVDRLLSDDFKQEFTSHWTTLWTNLLIGRTGGTGRDSLAVRAGMKQYLKQAFETNKSYEQLATELVTATGSCKPGDSDFNGAANFLADKMAEKGVQATALTSEIFLGMAVQCTQCHNHPFNEYRQNQFWEMNAFFRQTAVERQEYDPEDRRRYARLVDRDFAGEGGDPTKAELYYELRNGKLKVAYPVFVDGTSLENLYSDQGEDFGDSGYLEDIHRRRELAKMLVGSPEFSKAAVNRMWSRFYGYGFTKPIYDMGPHNTATHPELLDYLAEEFRASSFDMKQLMRWIVLSEAYTLSSRVTKKNESDDPDLGARPKFSHFYLRQMQAEQLFDSLLTATNVAGTLTGDKRDETKERWLKQFSTTFGTDDNSESTTFNGSIPQVLMMMNGDLMKKATNCEKGSFLHRIATDGEMSNAKKINHLYMAALGRRPSRNEIGISNQILKARGGNTPEALKDIWWAILNSNEFILIH